MKPAAIVSHLLEEVDPDDVDPRQEIATVPRTLEMVAAAHGYRPDPADTAPDGGVMRLWKTIAPYKPLRDGTHVSKIKKQVKVWLTLRKRHPVVVGICLLSGNWTRKMARWDSASTLEEQAYDLDKVLSAIERILTRPRPDNELTVSHLNGLVYKHVNFSRFL